MRGVIAWISCAVALYAVLFASSAVTARLDVVIFEDGLVVGPDQLGTVDAIRTRKAAVDYVLGVVKNAEAGRAGAAASTARCGMLGPTDNCCSATCCSRCNQGHLVFKVVAGGAEF